MQDEREAVGLFAISGGGILLVARTSDPELIQTVRNQIAAERRRELARLEPPVRLADRDANDDEPPAG